MLIVFKLQDIKEKSNITQELYVLLGERDWYILGCMQDSWNMLGGIMTLLLSLFGELLWF